MTEGPLVRDSAEKVQRALRELGISTKVLKMPASTRTAQEAAAAIGCSVGQIAKSLIFRGTHSAKPLLIIASGTNRVNVTDVANIVGEPLERATPDFVRDVTGYPIGGVPPLAHSYPLPTWFDEALFSYKRVWAAAGTPYSVFEISPQDLVRITNATLIIL